MGIIYLKDGYELHTYDMTVYPTEMTFNIMATKIQKLWKSYYYKNLLVKAYNKRKCVI